MFSKYLTGASKYFQSKYFSIYSTSSFIQLNSLNKYRHFSTGITTDSKNVKIHTQLPLSRNYGLQSMQNLDEMENTKNPILSFSESYDSLKVTWADGHKSSFDYLWLRDNCHCSECHHPDAEERMMDTLSIPFDISPKNVKMTSNGILIQWKDKISSHISTYSYNFLHQHCFSPEILSHHNSYESILWKAKDMKDFKPLIEYSEIMNDDTAFAKWMKMIRLYGFSIIQNVPKGDLRPESVAQRISFLRTTFWGDSWSVRSEPNPRNLSLTGAELYPHTDFSWSETPPGLQFLHCVEFSGDKTVGGESTLVDGYAVAEYMRQTDPKAFHLLSEIPIKHYFSSKDQSYSYSGPTFKLEKSTGLIQSIRYNQANRAPLEISNEIIRPFYRALNAFSSLIRSKEFLLDFRLQEGQMLVFNNHRLLHGRLKYDAQRTKRHLKGCYLDLEQFESRYSVLTNSNSSLFYSSKKNLNQFTCLNKKFNSHIRQFSSLNQNIPKNSYDPGFDKYNDEFIRDALKEYQEDIQKNKKYEDGSSLKEVVDQGHASFTKLSEGTKADFIYQCALFGYDIETNFADRIIGMLKKLEGDHIRLGTGAQVDLFEHSIQCGTRAYNDGADEEMIIVALLHDIGEMMSPMNHGEVAGAMLRPYISPEAYWILKHHEIFQGYYYFHHVGGNRNTRDLYKDHPQYQETVDFCERWDQTAFDPKFESYPIDFFKPILKKVLSRQPYWFHPNHPKLGVVTIQDDAK